MISDKKEIFETVVERYLAGNQEWPLEIDPSVLFLTLTGIAKSSINVFSQDAFPQSASSASKLLFACRDGLRKQGYDFWRERSGSKGRIIKFYQDKKNILQMK